MKGLEFKTLLGLIILIVVILLIIIIAINPSLLFGEQAGAQISFREFCVFWSLSGYAEGFGDTIEAKGELYSVDDMCEIGLGKPPGGLETGDLENCKNLCKVRV